MLNEKCWLFIIKSKLLTTNIQVFLIPEFVFDSKKNSINNCNFFLNEFRVASLWHQLKPLMALKTKLMFRKKNSRIKRAKCSVWCRKCDVSQFYKWWKQHNGCESQPVKMKIFIKCKRSQLCLGINKCLKWNVSVLIRLKSINVKA